MNRPVLVFEARRHTATRERDRVMTKIRRLQRLSRFQAFVTFEIWLDCAIAKYEEATRRGIEVSE